MSQSCSNKEEGGSNPAQKLYYLLLDLIKQLHSVCGCVILFVLSFVVTNTSKNTQSEADKISSKSSIFVPVFTVLVSKLMEKLIDIMEDDDDVQNVWHNWDQE